MWFKTWLKQQWIIRHRKIYGELHYLLNRIYLFGDIKAEQEYETLIYKATKAGDDEYVDYLQELEQDEAATIMDSLDLLNLLVTRYLTRQETRQGRLEGIRRQIDKIIEIRKESGEIK